MGYLKEKQIEPRSAEILYCSLFAISPLILYNIYMRKLLTQFSHTVQQKDNLHYIWIGPPRPQVPGAGLTQDIMGPVLMRNALNSSGDPYIYFWCEDRYVSHYKSLLKGITVRGCSAYIAECCSRGYQWLYWHKQADQWVISKLGQLYDWSLRQNYKRDTQNAKNLFAFLILYTWGGYTLDTNIIPESGKKPEFHSYPGLKVPAFLTKGQQLNSLAFQQTTSFWYSHKNWNLPAAVTSSCNLDFNTAVSGAIPNSTALFDMSNDAAYSTATLPLLECWLMYSPRYNAAAFYALEYYARVLENITHYRTNRFHQSEAEVSTYHDMCGAAVIYALSQAYIIDDVAHVGNDILNLSEQSKLSEQFISSGSFFPIDSVVGDKITVPELKVTKIYHNTHKYKDPTQ